jgi:hypothetical protein
MVELCLAPGQALKTLIPLPVDIESAPNCYERFRNDSPKMDSEGEGPRYAVA